MPSVEDKPKSFRNKHFGQLQMIKNDVILRLALDEVKNEFVQNLDIHIDIPDTKEEDVDNMHEERFMARRFIYNLLKSIKSNADRYEELESDLEKSEFSSDFKDSLKEVCQAMLTITNGSLEDQACMLPKYKSCSWSVDIDLSSSYAKKLLETSVLLNLELEESNGNNKSTKTIMMTSDKFNDLRFKVAEALKTLQDLKKRKMFAPT